MKLAWVENNQIRDVSQGDPAAIYHPVIAANYDASVPDNAENGDGWVNGVLVKPVIPAPVNPAPAPFVPPTVTPVQFQMLFTSAERVKARALRATDAVLNDFWLLLDDPRTLEVRLALASVQGAVEYTLTVVKAGGVVVDVPARKAAILSGIPQ